VNIFNLRLKGYIEALNVHNIPVNEDLIVHGKVSIESGRECMKHLLTGVLRPDAVFAVEDFTALGAMQTMKAASLKIPEDIAIVGFANEAFGEYLTPSLSTVNQQTVTMGEEAARLLFEGLRSGEPFHAHPRKLVLKPQLICRESSMKFQL
jgi:LacI family transcriptional regulator